MCFSNILVLCLLMEPQELNCRLKAATAKGECQLKLLTYGKITCESSIHTNSAQRSAEEEHSSQQNYVAVTLRSSSSPDRKKMTERAIARSSLDQVLGRPRMMCPSLMLLKAMPVRIIPRGPGSWTCSSANQNAQHCVCSTPQQFVTEILLVATLS